MSGVAAVTARTRMVFALQRGIVAVAFRWNRIVRSRERQSVTWVVGPEEIASMVHHVAEGIPGSHSVSLVRHEFYDHAYDTELPRSANPLLDSIRRVVVPPMILARLANRAEGFIYLGPTGYLLHTVDQRAAEFGFLRKHGIKLVCLFTGSDIRAPRLMQQLKEQRGEENLAGHYGDRNEVFHSEEYDWDKRRIAAVADEYADAIINPPVDQLSYLTRATEPFMYFYPDANFQYLPNKFDAFDPMVIVHAPSAPAIKGTPLVHDAIERLRVEGYEFDYRELVGATNDDVRRQLASAHIVLNQFYAYLPGVFGIEALASCCAMLASADPTIETTIAPGAEHAWLVTKHDQVYENLKSLLDHPERIKPLALAGYQWALENESASASRVKMLALLDSVLKGSYTPTTEGARPTA